LSPVSPEPTHVIVPVVAIFCVPKFGDIFVPAIAAAVLISASIIVLFAIFAVCTELSPSSEFPIAFAAI